MTILVESREPKSIFQSLESKGIDVKRTFSEVGDYLLNSGVAIERKAGRDLTNSLNAKRLYTQLINLNQYETPILAIVTDNLWRDFYFSQTRYIHSVYLGTLATLIARFPKIRILHFESDELFVDFLVMLDKKLNEEASGERPVQLMRRTAKLSEKQENALTAANKIGIKSAQALLKHYGSISNLCNAELDDIQNIKGINKDSASNVYNLLHEEYNSKNNKKGK